MYPCDVDMNVPARTIAVKYSIFTISESSDTSSVVAPISNSIDTESLAGHEIGC